MGPHLGGHLGVADVDLYDRRGEHPRIGVAEPLAGGRFRLGPRAALLLASPRTVLRGGAHQVLAVEVEAPLDRAHEHEKQDREDDDHRAGVHHPGISTEEGVRSLRSGAGGHPPAGGATGALGVWMLLAASWNFANRMPAMMIAAATPSTMKITW